MPRALKSLRESKWYSIKSVFMLCFVNKLFNIDSFEFIFMSEDKKSYLHSISMHKTVFKAIFCENMNI